MSSPAALLATGMPAEKIERVWAPAGLDLGASTPEEIALSIVSQMVALRRGGSVKTLKESDSTSNRVTIDKVISPLRGRPDSLTLGADLPGFKLSGTSG